MLACCLRRWHEAYLGLSLHRRETRRKVFRRLKSVGQIVASSTETSLTVVLKNDATKPIEQIIELIDRDLAVIANRPLTSHEVQDALGITARERIRWTNDGRLRTSGTFTTQRQQIVTINMYAVDDIEKLCAQPATIEAWRDADRAAATNILSDRDPT